MYRPTAGNPISSQADVGWSTWDAAGMRCISYRYGMECYCLYSLHGFVLSRDTFNRY
jgi:hypothetical protein